MKLEYVKPADIEKRSFEILTKELEDMGIVLEGDEAAVIKRCIHTTADFDYAHTMRFSDNAINKLKELIRNGAHIITDTNMAFSGINKSALSEFGAEAHCFMSDPTINYMAIDSGVTRSSLCMKRAKYMDGPVIFVVGNAPTALVTIREMYDSKEYNPAFVIGVPVGFVNVVAAKELIMDTDIPYIINEGRKGGSNVAAAIVNAVVYSMREK